MILEYEADMHRSSSNESTCSRPGTRRAGLPWCTWSKC